MSATPLSVWVFHRGALGDSVILWPIFRALKSAGVAVTLVTDREKAELASREVGIDAVDIEQPRFNQLWIPSGRVEPVRGVDVVFSFHADGRRGVWADNAARVFPGARIRVLCCRPDQRLVGRLITRPPSDRPGSRRDEVAGPYFSGAIPEPIEHPSGPIVVHVGAGAESKRWPLNRWTPLLKALRAHGAKVEVIAGEVEAEKFSPEDRRHFAVTAGRYLSSLADLARAIRPATLYIGFDSGPTHLAAAMGVHTAVIFGPTDPRRWLPRGPSVLALIPRFPIPAEQVQIDDVISQLLAWHDRHQAAWQDKLLAQYNKLLK